jgi:hypothetical protein
MLRPRRIAWIALATAAVAGPGSAAALSSTSAYFRGPGRNVVCGYFAGAGEPASLECGVPTGLKPPPPRPSARDCHDLDFASDRVRLAATGQVIGFCSGDVGVLAELGSAPVLAYGKTWREGPFTCTSSVAWITCKNRSGHGFALSRLRWHRF